MRPISILFSTMLMFFAACGGDDPCIKTDTACLEKEAPDNLVMDGEWEGTYSVDRHMLGTNNLQLKWYGDTYLLRVERDGWEREPFFKTTSFKGYGSLEPGQRHFKAKYTVDEVWHFYGKYYLDDLQIVFKGYIQANGKTIGDFRLARNRRCASVLKTRQNVCLEDQDLASVEPAIDSATLNPNPVLAGMPLQIEATAAPAAEWRWSVSLVPVTDPTNVIATFEQQAEVFSLSTTAPTMTGEYAVRIKAEGNGRSDEREELLTVR